MGEHGEKDEEEWPPKWTDEHEKAVQRALKSNDFGFMGEEWVRERVRVMYPQDLKGFFWMLDTEKEREEIAEMDDDAVFVATGEELFSDKKPWEKDWRPGTIVDLAGYWDIIHTPQFGRLCQIHQLGPMRYIYKFMDGNTRYTHSIMTLHWARKIADAVGLKGKQRKLAELDAFLHDIGHLTGGHATETYLKQRAHFSHEEFGLSQLKDISEYIEKHGVTLDELIPVFLEKDPLSDIVSGQAGADRLAYAKHDLSKAILDIQNRGIMPELPFPRMDRIAQSFTFADGKYVPQASAADDVAKLITLRSMAFAFFYFNRNAEIAEVIFSKVLRELGVKDPEKIKDYTDFCLDRSILSSKIFAGVKRRRVIDAFKMLTDGYVPPFAASLKLEEGMAEDDNRNMCDGYSFKTCKYPSCYAEQITEAEREALRKRHSTPQAVRGLENKLMRKFGMGRMDVYICNYIQRDVAPKDVHLWDGKEMINLHDERPDLRQNHARWMRQNYGFRIAVTEQHHAKVMEYFARKKNLLKFVMDSE